MSRIISSSLFAIIFLFALTTMTSAKLTIIPTLSVLERYNDNIFLEESNEKDDFITIVSPKVFLHYIPNKNLDFTLDYALNFRFYSEYSEFNDTSIRETQRANLQAHARPFNYMYIDVSDSYRRIPVDVRSATAPENDFENMTDSNIFSVSPYIEFPVTTTILSRFGYRYTNIWFKSAEGNDSESSTVFTTLSKTFPTGLNVSVNYKYIVYRPELTDRYDGHQGTLTANYQVGQHLTLWGGIGKTRIDFDKTPNADTDIWNVGSEYSIPFLGGTSIRATYSVYLSDYNIEIDALNYPETIEITDMETYLTDTYFLRDRDSISEGISKTKRFDLSLTTKKYFEMSINPYYSEDDELETRREDRIRGVAVYIKKPLTTKLSVNIDGLWEKAKFQPDNNKVRRYIVGGSFDYLVNRKLTTSIGYRYNERDSEEVGDDFRNNIVWIRAALTF